MPQPKIELRRAIESLGAQSYFNIIHFNDRVGIWNAELVPANEENRSSATEHSDAFVPNGGTNLYGALELAFKDQRVDTICILSDGDPSAGDVVDPLSIQRIVEGWNRERRIKFNCIAIGSDLDVLKNLSEASGGGYLEIL